jgi:hypothetical protein
MFRMAFVAILVVMIVSPAFAQVQVFVTQDTYDGNFGDQAGGDTDCTNAAALAGLSGTWTAWLGKGSCGACDDPVDRIIDGEYQLLDGTVVANNKADLTDGTLDHAIDMDEDGNGQAGGTVWTGADADGTGTSGPGTCTVWTTNSDQILAQTGSTSATDEEWSDTGGGNPCDRLNRLYCFADQQVPVELQEFSVE